MSKTKYDKNRTNQKHKCIKQQHDRFTLIVTCTRVLLNMNEEIMEEVSGVGDLGKLTVPSDLAKSVRIFVYWIPYMLCTNVLEYKLNFF